MNISTNQEIKNTDRIEIRKIQALTGERSFTFVLPKQFALRLGIEKGDFLKCWITEDKLIVEKLK